MLPDPVTTQCAVYVYTGILDMRVGFARLAARIQEGYHRSAMQGGWHVFFGRTRDRVRIFYWDRDGYAMWTKRLEAGSYRLEKRDGYEELTAVDLTAILEGTELSQVKVRKNAENCLYS